MFYGKISGYVVIYWGKEKHNLADFSDELKAEVCGSIIIYKNKATGGANLE